MWLTAPPLSERREAERRRFLLLRPPVGFLWCSAGFGVRRLVNRKLEKPAQSAFARAAGILTAGPGCGVAESSRAVTVWLLDFSVALNPELERKVGQHTSLLLRR